jgi:hypothetical protein
MEVYNGSHKYRVAQVWFKQGISNLTTKKDKLLVIQTVLVLHPRAVRHHILRHSGL